MKRMHQIALLSCILLLTDAVYAADMGTPIPGLPSREISATRSWTAEEQALGEDFIVFAQQNNQTGLERILAQNPALINFKGKDGDTALTEAAYKGNSKIVERLIAAGADVNAQNDEDGWTALMWAAYRGHAEMVEKLIAAGAQVNTQDNNSWTALMRAAREGWKEIAQSLLAARAHSAITNNGKTALDIAQANGYTDIVELLQKHVDIEPEEETLMVKPAVD